MQPRRYMFNRVSKRETTSLSVLESRIQVERCMRRTRWFDGFECTHCRVPLLVHEDTSGGTSVYSPPGPLIIQCTNPACGHTQEYNGRTHKKFGCLENFSRHRCGHRFKMHPIPEMLNPPGEPIDCVVSSSL